MKILILRWGTLGDLVLTFPLLYTLKQAGFEINLFTRSNLLNLSRELGLVNGGAAMDSTKLLPLFSGTPLPSDLREFIASHDFVISYTSSREKVNCILSEILKERLLTWPVDKNALSHHLTEHLFEPVKKLGVERIIPFPGMWKGTENTVLIHPGSGGKWKRWPKEKFWALIDLLYSSSNRGWKGSPLRVKIILGEAEETEIPYWEKISEVEPHGTESQYRYSSGYRDIGIIFNPPLSRLKQILLQARLFVGNDSGVTHLAAFLGVPTLSIFGPTSPRVWGPRGKRVKIIYRKYPCSPCSKTQRAKCRDFPCLQNISAEEVVGIISILSSLKSQGNL
ncbi:MAG: glycosyltransferase family 9 protein [Caldiserica bacterium]|nr:glycosyltransferase family 9 protein [Caldisericota bacterium]